MIDTPIRSKFQRYGTSRASDQVNPMPWRLQLLFILDEI
jgi:hypothetical protein